jgi:hypothetical protein
MCGYGAAYVHSFCMLYCVERHVDSVLMCDIWINVLLQTSALVGPLHITKENIWNVKVVNFVNETVAFTDGGDTSLL